MARLVGIGEVARSLGLTASALRYYEERGLIRPVTRRAGARMYDEQQIRRLVLVQMMHDLGVPLVAAGALLDDPSDAWRAHLTAQIQHLDDVIARAALARDFLAKARECGTDHPVAECPQLQGLIDRRLAGTSFDQLVEEHSTAVSRSS